MNSVMRKQRGLESISTERLALAFTHACGVAISIGILAALIYLAVAIASIVTMHPAFDQAGPEAPRVQVPNR